MKLNEIEVSKGGSGKYGKLRDGLNLLRIVSEFEPIYSHWDNAEKKGHTCTNNKLQVSAQEAKEGTCKYCKLEWANFNNKMALSSFGKDEKGKKIWPPRNSVKYAVNCINLNTYADKLLKKIEIKDEDYQINYFEIPVNIIEQIKQAVSFDPDWAWDMENTPVPPYDIKITRFKTGPLPIDIDYRVERAKTDRPLTDLEVSLMREFDSPATTVDQKIAYEYDEAEPINSKVQSVFGEGPLPNEPENVDISDVPF